MADENKTALGDALANAGYKSEGGEIGKRGPGRPPKTTAGVNNTVDTYQPSVERNNIDQALQPTGPDAVAGLGGTDIHDGAKGQGGLGAAKDFQASRDFNKQEGMQTVEVGEEGRGGAGGGSSRLFGGKGDHDEGGKVGGATKYFPVLLKRNYRPLNDGDWKIVREDGSLAAPPPFEDGTSPKAPAGYKIALPIEEAKGLINRGIAERADEIA
jgi:hypothetical protein